MNNTLSITEYNLLDYSLKLQEAVEKGYRVSDSVDGSPIMVGFVYTATLVKREADVVGELAVKVKIDTTELQEQLNKVVILNKLLKPLWWWRIKQRKQVVKYQVNVVESNYTHNAQVPTTIIVCIVSGWVLVAVDEGVRLVKNSSFINKYEKRDEY